MPLGAPATLVAWLLAGCVSLLGPGAGWAQATRGSVAGRIVDALSGRPVEGAVVSLVDSRARSRTDRRGDFRLADVPSGVLNVRVKHPDYVAIVEQIPVAPGDATLADFTLMPLSTVLGPLVVMARRDPEGVPRDSAGRVVPAERSPAVVRNTGELIDGGIAGAVALTGSGQVGAGVRIQIRGRHSFTLSGDPLVYLDGVRVSQSIGTGPAGRGTSILDLVEPAMIDYIEVLRGPDATVRYGLGAGNGVILIYTKRRPR